MIERLGVAAAAALMLGSLAAFQSPDTGAGAVAANAEARPRMSLAELRTRRSRNLGEFPDEAAAVAAYRAARLPRGVVGVAFAGLQQVAITEDGRVYDLPVRRSSRVRSGPGQRPPQRATVRDK